MDEAALAGEALDVIALHLNKLLLDLTKAATRVYLAASNATNETVTVHLRAIHEYCDAAALKGDLVDAQQKLSATADATINAMRTDQGVSFADQVRTNDKIE